MVIFYDITARFAGKYTHFMNLHFLKSDMLGNDIFYIVFKWLKNNFRFDVINELNYDKKNKKINNNSTIKRKNLIY